MLFWLVFAVNSLISSSFDLQHAWYTCSLCWISFFSFWAVIFNSIFQIIQQRNIIETLGASKLPNEISTRFAFSCVYTLVGRNLTLNDDKLILCLWKKWFTLDSRSKFSFTSVLFFVPSVDTFPPDNFTLWNINRSKAIWPKNDEARYIRDTIFFWLPRNLSIIHWTKNNTKKWETCRKNIREWIIFMQLLIMLRNWGCSLMIVQLEMFLVCAIV